MGGGVEFDARNPDIRCLSKEKIELLPRTRKMRPVSFFLNQACEGFSMTRFYSICVSVLTSKRNHQRFVQGCVCTWKKHHTWIALIFVTDGSIG